jgi:hypothetical protein
MLVKYGGRRAIMVRHQTVLARYACTKNYTAQTMRAIEVKLNPPGQLTFQGSTFHLVTAIVIIGIATDIISNIVYYVMFQERTPVPYTLQKQILPRYFQ